MRPLDGRFSFGLQASKVGKLQEKAFFEVKTPNKKGGFPSSLQRPDGAKLRQRPVEFSASAFLFDGFEEQLQEEKDPMGEESEGESDPKSRIGFRWPGIPEIAKDLEDAPMIDVGEERKMRSKTKFVWPRAGGGTKQEEGKKTKGGAETSDIDLRVEAEPFLLFQLEIETSRP